MSDVNATARRQGHSGTRVVSSAVSGPMGREVFLPHFGTVDLPSVWHSMGFVGQHSFLLGCLVGGTSTIKSTDWKQICSVVALLLSRCPRCLNWTRLT
jgi:hypothetical protein